MRRVTRQRPWSAERQLERRGRLPASAPAPRQHDRLPVVQQPEVPHLDRAEHVDKLHAICIVCGEEASRTQRLIDGIPAAFDDPVVLVGAAEVYEARCRQHHQVRPPQDGGSI